MKTTQLLIPLCLALGALVWLDNTRDDSAATDDPQVIRAIERETRAPEAAAGQLPGQNPSTPRAGTIDNPLSAIDKESLSATLDRPLFAPQRSRRPVVVEARVEAPPPPPPPPPLPSYVLLGVVTHDGRAIALLSRATDGMSFRVEKGETIGGWRVQDVGARFVNLVGRDGISVTVPLSSDRQKPQSMPDPNAVD